MTRYRPEQRGYNDLYPGRSGGSRGSDGYRPSYDAPPPPPPPPGVDTYRPYDGRDFRRYPPPPPAHGNDSYRSFSDSKEDRRADFRGGDVYRPPSRGFDQRPPEGEFSFRVEKPAGIADLPTPDSYRPQRGPNSRSNRGAREYQQGRRDSRRDNRGGGQWFTRDAAQRPILIAQHTEVPKEILHGDGSLTYRHIDELSDDDETDMEISEHSGDESDAHRNKRARRADVQSEVDNTVPKWSNADAYAVISATEDTTRKKKDVVKLIRKARVEDLAAKFAAVDTEEFISLNLDDSGSENSVVALNLASKGGNAPSGAPTGPRNSIGQPAELPDNPTNGQDSPLGSRKRTADGRIKPKPLLKKANKMPVKGHVVEEWQALEDREPCPWATINHSKTTEMGVWSVPRRQDDTAYADISGRLHKEIMDFYDYVKPRRFEQRMRQDLVDRLRRAIRRSYHDAEVLPFGSFVSGLYLPTADMDLVICSKSFLDGRNPKYSAKKHLWSFRNFLESNGFAERNTVEVIAKAKVPLVKFIDTLTDLKVDISFERYDGVRAIDTFLAWKEQYPSMPILVTLIKHFLAMRGLNEPVNGGIGGFSVICLVVSMLQLMPQAQSRSMKPEHHLGEMFMEFLRLYGHDFDFQNVAIRMNPPGYINKVSHPAWVSLSIDTLALTIIRERLAPSRTGTKTDSPSSTQTTMRTTYLAARPMQQSSCPTFVPRSGTLRSGCLRLPRIRGTQVCSSLSLLAITNHSTRSENTCGASTRSTSGHVPIESRSED
jgi:non-canonical poly(A) RNA polymerase PAPD5/7